MTDKPPASRPALRKSVDAAIHPALAGRSSPLGGSPAAAAEAKAGPATAPSARADNSPRAGARPLTRQKRAPTSDVLRARKSDPAVLVKVEMPKSLRKRLRAAAKEQGLSAEELAAQLIAAGLQRR